MEIEWKICNHNSKYEVSNSGLVRRIDSGHILQGCIAQGYRSIKLTFENSVQKRFKAHRLVAELFVENPDPIHKTLVNHKDGNKLNNCYLNLEWVTPRENNLHYYMLQKEKIKEKRKQSNLPIPIIQYSLDFKEINRFPSMSKASKQTGIPVVQIARGIHEGKKSNGYIWKKQEFLND